MLSKLFARGLACRKLITPSQVMLIQPVAVRQFRSDFVNPYKHDPTALTEQERQKQQELPVWERTFDYKKYMQHDGPLKVS